MTQARSYAAYGALILLTLVAYGPIYSAGFVWDDDAMVTKNVLVHAADGFSRIWLTTQPTDYWPVTNTSFWLEWRWWGAAPLGYHLTNVLLHTLEVCWLWSLLKRLQIGGAWVAAALFAVHPINVESVAWIAERKNVLALFFYLGAIDAFLRSRWGGARPSLFAKASGDKPGAPGPTSAPAHFSLDPWYFLSLLAFALGLLAKGSVAPLPLVLLGLIAWRRPLTWRDGLASAPFFVTAAGLVLVDIWFQHHGGPSNLIRTASPLARALGAGAAVDFYLLKGLLPAGLCAVYPQWAVDPAQLRWWLPALGAVGITAVLWHYRRRGTRPALFAWGYFVVALVPALGLTDVYFMRYSLVADHYEHLALIGLVALVAFVGSRLAGSPLARSTLVQRVAGAVVIGLLMVLTWQRCEAYHDLDTYYRAILARNPRAWMALNNLGGLELRQGRIAEATALLQQSVDVEPRFGEAYRNLGQALYQAGHYPEAAAAYRRAITIDDRDYQAEYDLGFMAAASQDSAAAALHYQRASALNPSYPEPHNGLGLLRAAALDWPGAIAEYRAALLLDSGNAGYYFNLGMALLAVEAREQAITAFRGAIALQPTHARAHNNLAIALAETGRLDEAIAEFGAAVRLDPAEASYRQNWAAARQSSGAASEVRPRSGGPVHP